MTTIYFIRHTEADASINDQRTRPLTQKGLSDRKVITRFFQDKQIHAVLSSPYVRTVETITEFAESINQKIETVEAFRGLSVNGIWIDSYKSFFEKYWLDFTYHYADGESFLELKNRTIPALNLVLNKHKNENIVICTHSVSLGIILNHYDKTFTFEDFVRMEDDTSWVTKLSFVEETCIEINQIPLSREF